jgi:hypothetical protein
VYPNPLQPNIARGKDMSTEATRLVDSNGQTYGKRGDEEAGYEDVETFTYGDFIKVSKTTLLWRSADQRCCCNSAALDNHTSYSDAITCQ